mmetsp:Transcript_2467/g.5648  ORF Transcript_2467/g.5648 Transcript_2467/m.5648 type:complete len:974 (+) Transcript_2467:1-2922(+)
MNGAEDRDIEAEALDDAKAGLEEILATTPKQESVHTEEKTRVPQASSPSSTSKRSSMMGNVKTSSTENLEDAHARNSSHSTSTNVRVCCRFRPANRVETTQGADRCVSFGQDKASVKLEENNFTFDRVFQEDSCQEDVYNYCAKPLVQDVLDGYNCTIFAYGQTGSGKTHTMMGPEGGKASAHGIEDLRGVVPRIAEDIFHSMTNAEMGTEFIIKVSFVEIYMERIRDLLNPSARNQNLRVRDVRGRGVVIEGAEEVYVSSTKELLKVAAKGNASRAIASTRMNQDSSRSHSVFMITVAQRQTQSTQLSRTGKLFLVDLAGSEMVKKTGATSGVLEEAKTINRSLSALGNVIKALVEGAKHVPYRDSKLTRCLQDSLGGNSKTSLIITCSGFSYNSTETLSTLRFGTRAKRIKNKPKVNREFSVAEYKTMVEQTKDALRLVVEYARSLEADLGIEVKQSPVQQTKDKASFTVTPRDGNQDSHHLIPSNDDMELENHDDEEDEETTNTKPSKPPRHSQESLDRQQASCPENARYPPQRLSQSSSIVPLAGSPDQPLHAQSASEENSVLARAEEALTRALANVDLLRAKLEEAQTEAEITKDALEGARTRNQELEDDLGKSSKAQSDLVQRVAKLELYKQQAEFREKEMQLTMRGLEDENKLLKQHLGSTNGEIFYSSFGPQSTQKKKKKRVTDSNGPDVGAKADPEESKTQQEDDSEEASQEALLKSDLVHITEKYIQLRLEHLEAQELIAAHENRDLSEINDILKSEREHNRQLNARIRTMEAKIELLNHNEVLWKLKLENREEQINFLEAALHDYQGTFKSHVEVYQAQVNKLSAELTSYRLAFDRLESEEETTCSEAVNSEEFMMLKNNQQIPRVIKPVRGGGASKPPLPKPTQNYTGNSFHSFKSPSARKRFNSTPLSKTQRSNSHDSDDQQPSPAKWLMDSIDRLAPPPRSVNSRPPSNESLPGYTASI